MPILIWGSRGLTSELESGDFYCPHCNATVGYRLKQNRPFFTLFFIPIFPIGGAERYVECTRCGQTYREEVLDMRAPTEGERLMGQMYGELQTGSSTETVQRKLESMGMHREKAEAVLADLTEGKVWACTDCGEHYLESVKKCLRCRA